MEYQVVPDIKAILEECFATDLDLLNRYHIEAPAPLVTCVNRTYKDLMSCPEIVFYKIFDLSRLIGYFCKETDKYGNKYLTGFFLKPEYRNWDYIKEFWSIVNKEIGEDYSVGLYEKNSRAVKFIERSGGKFFFKGVDVTGNDYISFNMKNPCQ